MGKRLTKSSKDRKIFGVCGGVAEYLECDPTLVRLVTAIATVACGAGLLIYLVAAIVMPNDDRMQG